MWKITFIYTAVFSDRFLIQNHIKITPKKNNFNMKRIIIHQKIMNFLS